MQPVKLYFNKDYAKLISNNDRKNVSQIVLLQGDCFEAAKYFGYKNTVIHNFANNEHQGGPSSIFTNSGKFIDNTGYTQEDQIIRFYTTNLILPKSLYPICTKENGDAIIFSQSNSLPSLITCPAVFGFNNMEWQKVAMINRLKLMLATCAKLDKIFITGLWGCGAFGCAPVDLLSLWSIVLQDNTIVKPKQIVFAILPKEKKNFELFKNL